MRSAYVTNDPVERFSLRDFVTNAPMPFNSIEIDHLSYYDPPPDGQYTSVLYDLDNLPDGERSRVLARLIQGVSHRAAVHSFNLSDDTIEKLKEKGVKVYRRLTSNILRFF